MTRQMGENESGRILKPPSLLSLLFRPAVVSLWGLSFLGKLDRGESSSPSLYLLLCWEWMDASQESNSDLL